MTKPAIRISNLSKSYRIQRDDTPRATNLGEAVSRKLRAPFKKTPSETFWALKDIDLEIEQGEVVGVIGRNGAGKSTLLKVLSRITEPTAGRIELFGRVGSLLEVGTGFHPELTGRENIYLNGAILGMQRGEIKKQFDEIINFAGIEKFLDTPVKRYSSGMYVRLAFAVAAHLNPEILIVDEVLAVGDAEFQKKCLGKMQDVARNGRTVLLVSHQMLTIESLATKCVLMQSGEVIKVDSPRDVIADYTKSGGSTESFAGLADQGQCDPSGGFRMTSLEFRDGETFEPIETLVTGRSVRVYLNYNATRPLDDISVSLGVKQISGNLLASFSSDAIDKHFRVVEGKGRVECVIERWPVTSGQVVIALLASYRGAELHWIPEAGIVSIESGDFYGTGRPYQVAKQRVLTEFDWTSETSCRARC